MFSCLYAGGSAVCSGDGAALSVVCVCTHGSGVHTGAQSESQRAHGTALLSAYSEGHFTTFWTLQRVSTYTHFIYDVFTLGRFGSIKTKAGKIALLVRLKCHRKPGVHQTSRSIDSYFQVVSVLFHTNFNIK